jgi:hypothetical protein
MIKHNSKRQIPHEEVAWTYPHRDNWISVAEHALARLTTTLPPDL